MGDWGRARENLSHGPQAPHGLCGESTGGSVQNLRSSCRITAEQGGSGRHGESHCRREAHRLRRRSWSAGWRARRAWWDFHFVHSPMNEERTPIPGKILPKCRGGWWRTLSESDACDACPAIHIQATSRRVVDGSSRHSGACFAAHSLTARLTNLLCFSITECEPTKRFTAKPYAPKN